MKALRTVTIALFIISAIVYFGVAAYYQIALDRVPPQILCASDILEVSVADDESALLSGITARDNRDGDLTGQVMVQGVSRLLSANTARVTYVVFDSSKNMASCTRTIRYTDYSKPVITLKEAPVYAAYPTQDSFKELHAALGATDVRDGDLTDSIHIASQNINDSLEGTYTANVQVTNSLGDCEIIPLYIVIDNDAQEAKVTLREYITYVEVGSPFNPRDYITTVQGRPYAGSDSNLRIESDVNTETAGYYHVSYNYSADGQIYTVYLAVVVR